MTLVKNYARPHPSPLPRGEGTAMCVCNKFVRRGCNRRTFTIRSVTPDNLTPTKRTRDCRTFLPLPGGEGRGEGGCHFFQLTFSNHEH
jgi:hypothetical protein